MKGRSYENPEHVFDKLPKYHMNILLGDFSAKVGRKIIFKQTFGNESLHEISNDNGVRVVNLPHPIILLSQVRYSHVKFINLLGHLLMERLTIKLDIF
jgi:hypothetical protein